MKGRQQKETLGLAHANQPGHTFFLKYDTVRECTTQNKLCQRQTQATIMSPSLTYNFFFFLSAHQSEIFCLVHSQIIPDV